MAPSPTTDFRTHGLGSIPALVVLLAIACAGVGRKRLGTTGGGSRADTANDFAVPAGYATAPLPRGGTWR